MILLYIILIPFLLGLIFFLYPKKEFLSYKNPIYFFTILTLAFNFYLTLTLFQFSSVAFPVIPTEKFFSLLLTPLNRLFLVATNFFGLIIAIYSYHHKKKLYFILLLWIVSASELVLITNNLFVLLFAWGLVAVLLYFLILLAGANAGYAAQKALIMIGGSDALMLVSGAIVFYLTKTYYINQISITTSDPLSVLAFSLFLIGALTKAGAVPFHTWIPTSAEVAPVSVMALMPAALDKLLGIYLLIKVVSDFFHVLPSSGLSILIMAIGALTVIVGVLMALVQKDLIKLLSYHAISQVGYMIVGIGTELPLGVVGALFHMFNNTIYKTTLFLAGGAVKEKTGTTNLERLGGLISYMPLTFLATLISSLAISGIPPLNGFASKWLIYQAEILVINIKAINIIFIILTMFGSVLTLASFLKVLYSVFLGPESGEHSKLKEAPFAMLLPMLLLAALCLFLGIFPQIPINLISQALYNKPVLPIGVYEPGLITILTLLGIILGGLVFWLLKGIKIREREMFIGGEWASFNPNETVVSFHGLSEMKTIPPSEVIFPGTYFYERIKKIPPVGEAYSLADKKYFDLYEILKKVIRPAIKGLQTVHNGLLHTYLGWLFLAIIAIIIGFLISVFK
jgi:formate hydrogenlyase subunit 3/multisubunit Na+/H+ antiporter MnhD subunit